MTTANVSLLGRQLVAGELVTRGARCVEEFTALNRRMIRGSTPAGDPFEIIVKVRRSGDWQGSTNDGDVSRASPTVFWVFVDISSGPESTRYFIAPDDWVRADIGKDHAAYLEHHGGRRAQSDTSTHHAIEPWRVAEWENRWDLLRLKTP